LNGSLLTEIKGHRSIVRRVLFSPDGQFLATTAQDNTARLWNLQGRELARLDEHKDWAIGLTFSPDGQLLATSSADTMVRIWNVSDIRY
jgi:WD40 repeat protein